MVVLCENGYYRAHYDRYLNFDENTLKELNEYLKENSVPENYTELTEDELVDIMINRHDRDFYYADEPNVSWSIYGVIEEWATDMISSIHERVYDSDNDYCYFSWGTGR